MRYAHHAAYNNPENVAVALTQAVEAHTAQPLGRAKARPATRRPR